MGEVLDLKQRRENLLYAPHAGGVEVCRAADADIFRQLELQIPAWFAVLARVRASVGPTLIDGIISLTVPFGLLQFILIAASREVHTSKRDQAVSFAPQFRLRPHLIGTRKRVVLEKHYIDLGGHW